jgi:hypothetical protein
MKARVIRRAAILLLTGGVMTAAAPAQAIQCSPYRYLPVQSTPINGTGPRGSWNGSTVACANAKRGWNFYGGAWGDYWNYGPDATMPIGCDSLSVRVTNGSYQWTSWQTAGYNQLATAGIGGNILETDFRMNSVYSGNKTYYTSWTYTGYCGVD